MSDRTLCKYFASGCCKFGETCRFSHDFTAPQSMVCKYFLQGNCVFGDNCRYDHVRPEMGRAGTEPAVSSRTRIIARETAQSSSNGEERWAPTSTAQSFGNKSHRNAYRMAEEELPDFGQLVIDDNPNEDYNLWRAPAEEEAQSCTDDPEELMCWEHSTTGFCSSGADCEFLHGDFCEICQKYCLHQSDEAAREEHVIQCQQLHLRLQSYIKSTALECGICLEKVLSKAKVSDRRFGLMLCDHVFCLSCIRNWRSADDGSVDVASALRTCPVCRKTTHFVTPSSIFPTTDAEKTEIVEGYKVKLSKIDCKHFNFGEGQCPFVNSCFYRHAFRDGEHAELAVRKATNSDGDLRYIKPKLILADIIRNAPSRRVTRRRT